MPHIKSDPIPAVKDPPVKVVVANSLNDAVSTLEKNGLFFTTGFIRKLLFA